jgi:DNA mismatch repair protein PMS2
MATIKPIEARSVHQIQSGQVIVDLCSVVKELVENSLDASATSLEVRFKNNGLDSIEVQDNGSGISSPNYETLALKHHTSKLASYDDLSSLQTFGFRGEALSSLCALSKFYVITALADEAPKAKKLDFESSGKLKGVTVVAAQKGTTAVVEGLFEPLPVRRKELTKNIKKEYGKVLGLLHAYACISASVKFTVKSSMARGKSATVFATNANATTKENIANVYGAKTLSALVPLKLQLAFQRAFSQKDEDGPANQITVRGYISRPVFGEGRQTPDRQMFFVNGRPCGLPQIAKAFNEVYKSFNVLQSPFIFADFEMDTNAYDVNISPDKRTIMLHDSAALVDVLKSSLAELFDQQEHTMAHSQVRACHLPAYKQLTIGHESTVKSTDGNQCHDASRITKEPPTEDGKVEGESLLDDYFRNEVSTREEPKAQVSAAAMSKGTKDRLEAGENQATEARGFDDYDDLAESPETDNGLDHEHVEYVKDNSKRDFNLRMAEQQTKVADQQPIHIPASNQTNFPSPAAHKSPPRTSAVQTAFDRVRPTRPAAEVATITVGNKTITTMVGSQPLNSNATRIETRVENPTTGSAAPASTQAFTQRLRGFAARRIPIAQTSTESSIEAAQFDKPQNPETQLEIFAVENSTMTASSERADWRTFDDYGVNSDVESVQTPDEETDGEYIDECERKEQEDDRVAKLIYAAEEKATLLNERNASRANKVLLSGLHKDSTTSLQLTIAISIAQIRDMACFWHLNIEELPRIGVAPEKEDTTDNVVNEEERLALIVSKDDFSNMRVVGQFNLGFILAVRASSAANESKSNTRNADELFIVDQHASDEKYNFEKLQAETVVGQQRLVRPKQLDLTAVEEEILIENSLALEKNGFLVHIDTSEDELVGQRCKLIGLPLSKEVTFGLEDLEELLHVLAESPGLSQSSIVPRPSKVRKMFAMRACRSSIMIGKTLTEGKMKTVISNMGDIDKPWNCPHGRPTIRHLMTLNSFETWQEGGGVMGKRDAVAGINVWRQYAQ